MKVLFILLTFISVAYGQMRYSKGIVNPEETKPVPDNFTNIGNMHTLYFPISYVQPGQSSLFLKVTARLWEVNWAGYGGWSNLTNMIYCHNLWGPFLCKGWSNSVVEFCSLFDCYGKLNCITQYFESCSLTIELKSTTFG